MSIPRLIWIVLLTSGIAAADQGPLAHRGDWALGVALPSNSGKQLQPVENSLSHHRRGSESRCFVELRRFHPRRRCPQPDQPSNPFPRTESESYYQALSSPARPNRPFYVRPSPSRFCGP